MKIEILQREFDELRNAPDLFVEHNFRARKEALDFVQVICELRLSKTPELDALKKKVKKFGGRLRSYNSELFQDFRQRLKDKNPKKDEFRAWLLPYTDYGANDWGKPHYGYESLDFLLDGVFLPRPYPHPGLEPEYGMVRYEPTPASVILELVERLKLKAEDVFYDLGSGLGKVTLLVHLLTGAQVVGVEYQPEFCLYAASQADGLGLKGVHYINRDARQVDYADGNVFFLFNPFGGAIFDSVLENLHIEAKRREILICSYGSSSQPLSELGWLEPVPPIFSDEMALAVFRSVSPSKYIPRKIA